MYGNTNLPQNSIFDTHVSADGNPILKAGGATIDWSLVAAASGDTTLADGSVVRDGQKYLRYGQVLTKVTATGFYAPYDSALTQGSQLIAQGSIYVLDQTVLQYPSGSSLLGGVNDQIGGLIEGGSVWLDRIIQAGSGSHSKAAGPTLAELLAAMPNLRPITDTVTAG